LTKYILYVTCLTALKHMMPDMQTHTNAAFQAWSAPFKATADSFTHRFVLQTGQ